MEERPERVPDRCTENIHSLGSWDRGNSSRETDNTSTQRNDRPRTCPSMYARKLRLLECSPVYVKYFPTAGNLFPEILIVDRSPRSPRIASFPPCCSRDRYQKALGKQAFTRERKRDARRYSNNSFLSVRPFTSRRRQANYDNDRAEGEGHGV